MPIWNNAYLKYKVIQNKENSMPLGLYLEAYGIWIGSWRTKRTLSKKKGEMKKIRVLEEHIALLNQTILEIPSTLGLSSFVNQYISFTIWAIFSSSFFDTRQWCFVLSDLTEMTSCQINKYLLFIFCMCASHSIRYRGENVIQIR